MNIETKFNVGDVVCLDLGLVIEGGIRGVVVSINVEIAAIRQYITYTVAYDGNTITVPEAMLSRMTYTVQEKTEDEQVNHKEEIVSFEGKSYRKVFDGSSDLEECFNCVFCVIEKSGLPGCTAPNTKDRLFDGCADNEFHWELIKEI